MEEKWWPSSLDLAGKTTAGRSGKDGPNQKQAPEFLCPFPRSGSLPASCEPLRAQTCISKGPCLSPITPTSPPSRDSAGPLLCGLLSSPDVLLCHVRDWRDPAEAQANASCPGVTYDQDSRQATLRLGGQEIGGKCLPSSRVRSFTVTWVHQQGLLLCWEPSLYPEEFILPKRICTKMLH